MRAARHRAVVLLGIAVLGTLGIVGPVVGAAISPAQAVVVAEDDPAPADPAPADPAPADPAPADPAPAASEAAPEPAASEAAPEPAASEAAPSDEPSDAASDEPDPADSADATDADATDADATDGEPDPADSADASDEEDVVDEASMEPSTLEDPGSEAPVVEEETVDSIGGASVSIDIVDADGVQVSVSGSGLAPNSTAELWVFSTPRLVTTGVADADGNITLTATLPRDLGAGGHTVLLKGVDVDGQPVEFGSGIELGPNGELLAVTDGVDVTGLVTPARSDNPKAPPYAPVVALDSPAAVVSTTIAAFALVSVTGGLAAAGVAGRRNATPAGDGIAGGGINEGLGGGVHELLLLDVEHNRGWRTKFSPRGGAAGDRSALYRFPFTSYVDEASQVLVAAVGPKSPLLARIIGDGAPLRAMFGSLTLLLPIAGIILGIWSAIAGDGIAQPPALGMLIALMAIGVFDAFAGGLAALAFALTVALMGGIIDWSSVRTLLGVAMLIAGPGLVASSFRSIRRAAPVDFAGWWERLADVIIVPLLGAYTMYNVANAMPPLGGSLFPVAESSALLAWLVAALLVLKVVVEEVAARWFPERLATVACEADWPGQTQQVLSAILRLAMFLFISAAFIGMPWQLWVGGLIWFLPIILGIFSGRLPNAPRLWQILPLSMPYLGFGLLVYLILAALLGNSLGDGTEFALMSFFILMIPDLILGMLWLFGREPKEGDVRWYLRPSMVGVYRIGGVVVLIITCWLAVKSIF